MAVDKEPKVTKKKREVHGNFWNQDQVTGELEVSSGPLPTHEESPPLDGTGEEIDVEGSEVENEGSPQFPVVDPKKMERDFDAAGEPTKGAK
ncbi:MAG: hypothetical protein ACC618_00065 [Patescibacteria group bacterium]